MNLHFLSTSKEAHNQFPNEEIACSIITVETPEWTANTVTKVSPENISVDNCSCWIKILASSPFYCIYYHHDAYQLPSDWSFGISKLKTRRSTFLSYKKSANLLVLRLWNCEMFGQVGSLQRRTEFIQASARRVYLPVLDLFGMT